MASKEFHRYFFFLFSFLRRGISPILLNGSIEKEWPSSLPRIRAKEEREKAAERIERTYNCWEIENSAPINPATPCENDLLIGSFRLIFVPIHQIHIFDRLGLTRRISLHEFPAAIVLRNFLLPFSKNFRVV